MEGKTSAVAKRADFIMMILNSHLTRAIFLLPQNQVGLKRKCRSRDRLVNCKSLSFNYVNIPNC